MSFSSVLLLKLWDVLLLDNMEVPSLFSFKTCVFIQDPIGMLFLAHMYHYGHGKCMNTDKATSLYEKAAGIFRQKEVKFS